MRGITLLLTGFLIILLMVPSPAAAQDQSTRVVVTIEPFEGPIGNEPVTRQVKVEVTRFGLGTFVTKDMEMRIVIAAAPEWAHVMITPDHFVLRGAEPALAVRQVVYANLTVFTLPDATHDAVDRIQLDASTQAAPFERAGFGSAETPIGARQEEPVNLTSAEEPASEEQKFVSATAPVIGITVIAALALAARRLPRRRL